MIETLPLLLGAAAGAMGTALAGFASARFRPRAGEVLAGSQGEAVTTGGRLWLASVASGGVVGAGLAVAPGLAAPLVLVLAFCLAFASLVDAAWRLIPDTAPAGIAAAGLLVVLPDRDALVLHLLIAAVLLATLLALHVGHRRLRREDGIGMGDIKLIAAMALWLTPTGAAILVALSSLGGLAMVAAARRSGRTLEGVALAPAAAVAFVLVLFVQTGMAA